MEIDSSFVGKIAAHHMLFIFIPLAIILLICSIFIGIINILFKKGSIIALILRFVILSIGAMVFVALLPYITKLALS